MTNLNSTMQALQQKLFAPSCDKNKEDNDNVIRLTRKIIKNMDQTDRFEKARAHIIDALNSRYPRFETESLDTSATFRLIYSFYTSAIWEWLLFILGYIFMYLVILDNESYKAKISIESTILLLFWIDTVISYYVKQNNSFGKNKHSTILWLKFILLILMTSDLLIFIILPGYDQRPIRPFRILRCFIPMLYDQEMRKTFFSFFSAYTDIVVYFVFFTIVIGGWALIGSRALTFNPEYVDPQYPQHIDPYKNDYQNLSHMIFVIYVTATYDSYPDNQILAIQNYEPNYIFFIIFIFMNMFLFSSIPGSLIYVKFRLTRSKIILIDQIRQQHSLIIAFVTLAEDNKNLPITKLIKFLNYLYRYKIRCIEYITDICLKLDNNNSHSIQVNEFMQLSKIILENKAMTPPAFDDLEFWIKFRRWINEHFYFKEITQHWLFQFIVTIIILLSFVNALYYIYDYSRLVSIFDSIFVWIFFTELLIGIIGVGPENFFAERWNNLDTFLVIIGVFFFFIEKEISVSTRARMARIFRLASLFRVVSHSNYLKVQLRAVDKLLKIFSVILQIIPIILKFLPLFLFFFYIFAIIGMELFYNSIPLNGPSAYNMYEQYSSFKTFIQAQYIMVQIMTEAGWSMVAFDYSWKNPQYYGYTMFYFCLMHLVIVYIIATLTKGIFWQVFFTVNRIFQDRAREQHQQQQKQSQNLKRIKQIQQINDLIIAQQFIDPNSILKLQLYQNKLDSEIFQLLFQDKQKSKKMLQLNINYKPIASKKLIIEKIVKNNNVNIEDLEISQNAKQKLLKHKKNKKEIQSERNQEEKTEKSIDSSKSKISLADIEEVDQEDFESEIDDIFHHVVINPKARYSHIIGSNKVFKQFLQRKFVKPENFIRDLQFDLGKHPLYNKESILLHSYQIHSLLNIETSKRQHKAAIIKNLRDDEWIDEQAADKLIKKKLQENIFKIDTNGTLRKLFLSETNEALIKKFEIQYFSDLYGKSFKEITKLTLEPLLKVQATLTYSLRNILRYVQIDNTEFFEMFTHIDDQFSNKVLQKGSLFKFIYKLDTFQEIWFSIEYKQQQDMRVHFIKTGVWCYDEQMDNNQVYYARDVFKYDLEEKNNEHMCHKFIKRFYQSFQGLAFSLLDEKKFFQANPNQFIYDLYVQCFDAEPIQRFICRDFQISKIMVVILSKQEQRIDIGQPQLQYSLSDMILPSKTKKALEFTFEDTENDTYQKLKNLSALDHQKIIESEGLPFSYIINLMQEISDILKLYSHNFIYQIEKVFCAQFELMNARKKEIQSQILQKKSPTPERSYKLKE